MTVWWRVNPYAIEIKPVKVIYETAKFVTLAASESYFKRPRKHAKGKDYFPTFAEARNFLLDRFALNKFAAEALVLRCQHNWDKAAELKEPKS